MSFAWAFITSLVIRRHGLKKPSLTIRHGRIYAYYSMQSYIAQGITLLYLYHDASEREPATRDGDNSRSEESAKLEGYNQSRFLVIAKEALGLTFNQTLDSSYGLIEILLQEYSFVMKQRNKTTDEDGNVEGQDYEWVELPSFDDPSKTVRIKKYNDIAGKVKR